MKCQRRWYPRGVERAHLAAGGQPPRGIRAAILPRWGAVLLVAAAITAVPGTGVAQTAEQNDSSAQAAGRANGLPLIPTRTLDFTTNEGTWISLDLSPDGETILFELLGDLYTLPVSGGSATRITSGQGYDMQPRFSPDGGEIVFVSDRDGSENVWVARADGTDPRQLTDTERENYMSPVWTPDGEYVMTGKGTQLWLYPRGRGLGRTGYRAPGRGCSRAAHSPGGRVRGRSALSLGQRAGQPRGWLPGRRCGRGPGRWWRGLRSRPLRPEPWSPQFRARGWPVPDRDDRSRDGAHLRPHPRARGGIPSHAEPRRALAGVRDALRCA